MKIELKEVTVGELVAGYEDRGDGGVVAFGGKLDVRPAYQREFIYKDRQREAVIDTVTKGFPLNVMYWAARPDGTYEIIDGQQRTISICQFATGAFAYMFRYFHNLTDDEKAKFCAYKLMVYVCTGTDSEKLEWFRTINIAGEELTAQELRNAVYSGPWTSDAKRYFSKVGGAASNLGGDYMNGAANRQEFLETAIAWLVGSHKDEAICGYRAIHQNDPDATVLWLHFQKVVNWKATIFPKYRKEMKGLDWGAFHAKYGTNKYTPAKMEQQVAELMADKEVQQKRGIYEFLLSGRTQFGALNLRFFDPDDMRDAYERQKGVCPVCKKHFAFEEMRGDHIKPWSKGGKTVPDNLQMLCADCNARKSDKF